MISDDMNVASYIRERSEELRKLSKDARLDLLAKIFGMAALEATKHEPDMLPPALPKVSHFRSQVASSEHDATRRRAAVQELLEALVSVAANRSKGQARAAFYIANDVGTNLH